MLVLTVTKASKIGMAAPPEYPKIYSIPRSSKVLIRACAPSSDWLLIVKLLFRVLISLKVAICKMKTDYYLVKWIVL